jgi:hypothetical protein
MPYRIVQFENGTASIEDTVLNEPMHSRIGPLAEAKTLYLDQSKVIELLKVDTESPLVVYDVGLGLAVNALLPIEGALNGNFRRKLEIHSFENEIAGIQFALSHLDNFKFLESHQPKILSLLNNGFWESTHKEVIWKLHVGDFRQVDLTPLPSPEIIFYDFHSPKTSPELWNESIFNKVYDACKANKLKNINTLLITYSSARSVRDAMKAAGFYVGNGIPTSAKRDTTLATTLATSAHPQ